MCSKRDLKNAYFKKRERDVHKYTWVKERKQEKSLIDYVISLFKYRLKDVNEQRSKVKTMY